MKERPILMSAPMVRAILAGTKSQTRRAVKGMALDWLTMYDFTPEFTADPDNHLCPYGAPGDQLWVREAHWWFKDEPDHSCGYYPPTLTVDDVEYRADGEDGRKVWRPSILMPRWASRILLEVTEVRVERLQDISEADAAAEGVEPLDSDRDDRVFDRALCHQCGGTGLYTAFGPNLGAMPDTDCERCDTHAKRYRWLWESLNGPGSWGANPWVWVVSFKRISEGVTE